MTMQLRIKHTTGYHYEKGAMASFNEARMTPMTTSEQYVLRSRLDITPTPWSYEYRDYWGTTVTSFEVHDPHADLTVVATSTVETQEVAPKSHGIAWEDLVDDVRDEWCEYLVLSDWVAPAAGLADEIAGFRAEAERPSDYVEAVMRHLHDRVAYVPGSTEVTTTAADAWDARTGVCQDFAHLSLGALRAAGIPARYVSGYLHPSPDPVVGVAVEGESHAWIEWWDGEWVGWDPTNAIAPGPRHVVVAKGRDYGDSPPLRGIFSTAGGSELFVGVEITRLR
ncbi:transglutaminase family protein [Aeromicrobium sp. SMF47]|uniref:Transglutaminase family protein n=1 Tax=Aeromicrobium yanjiei TaxID=2662028 RepID=A0A5Q2MRA8_9ACTN|nr:MULTISPECIES: transglutaminase family protein [Aeromicrobium]MRJ75683.1 transglutaminase family protein [Aeromicrobium yanjiei]MRK00028.1 transglutaminase family protein [Aeromicrobium sp. S22]QGG43060.1 transglutaminase family protein [Aeromicrobium yanjiei]